MNARCLPLYYLKIVRNCVLRNLESTTTTARLREIWLKLDAASICSAMGLPRAHKLEAAQGIWAVISEDDERPIERLRRH